MAETLDELKAQRLALKTAMRSGALSVRHGDKSVQYRSMAEMRSALQDINDDIKSLSGRRRRGIYYLNARRGYE